MHFREQEHGYREQGYREHGYRREQRRDFRDASLRDRDTGDLLKELFAQAQVLVREELHLAKAETKYEAKKAVRAGAGFGAGGVLLHTALLVGAACLVAVGWSFLPLWASALIVCAIFAIAGAIALSYGKQRMDSIEPERTVQNLKENQRWAKDTMQSIRLHRHADA